MPKAEGKGKQRPQRRGKCATSSFNLPTAPASYHIDSVSRIYGVATPYMETLFDITKLVKLQGYPANNATWKAKHNGRQPRMN